MKKSEQLNNIIARLKGSRHGEEVKQIYRDWSVTYNQDLDYFGYMAPQIGADLFHQALSNSNGLIFDAGCGTGLCGQALAERGYNRIHGGDFSPDMLAKARKTGHYEKLIEVDFRHSLAIADATYEGVICMGVYNFRLKKYFLPELLRLTKPEGIICISCRPDYFENDLHLQAKAGQQAGILSIESISEQPYMGGQGVDAMYIVLRKR